jgi:hypothetical protein
MACQRKSPPKRKLGRATLGRKRNCDGLGQPPLSGLKYDHVVAPRF